MISLFTKRSRDTGFDDLGSAFQRAAVLFLNAAALHAVRSEADETQAYQSAMGRISAEMEEVKEPSAVLVLTGEAIRTIEGYNRKIESQTTRLKTELRNIVGMVAEAVVRISASSQMASDNLRFIEVELRAACQLDDIRDVKRKLRDTLDRLCSESARQQQETSAISGQLDSTNSSPEELPRFAEDLDHVTGLPGQEALKTSVRHLFGARGVLHAIVLRLERLAMINGRFGFENGNKILTMFSQLLTQKLGPNDQLFRWRGPGFVALVERGLPDDAVRAEALKIGSTRFDYTVETGNHSVLLTLTASGIAIPIKTGKDIADLPGRIESFLSEQHVSELRGKR